MTDNRDSVAPATAGVALLDEQQPGCDKSINQPLIKRVSGDLLWTVADRCPNLQPAILAELERRETVPGHAAPNGGQR